MSSSSGIELILAYFGKSPAIAAQTLQVAVTPPIKSEASALVIA